MYCRRTACRLRRNRSLTSWTRFAQAVMSIGAVKGVEIGDGFVRSSSLSAQKITILSMLKMEKYIRRQIIPGGAWRHERRPD